VAADRSRITARFDRRSRPCPVCGSHTKGCSVTADGLHLCRGEPLAGWRLDPGGPDAEGFRHYRGESDERAAGWPPTGPTWQCRAEGFARQLSARRRKQLADELGLPAVALCLLPLLGWHPDDPAGECWTFPECDGRGQVIGITRRFGDGSKQAVRGGRRGLTLALGWRDRGGPVYVVEGASDTLALSACGLCAVGRPSAAGGADMLAELLRDWPAARGVVVLGENDRRHLLNGRQWHGHPN
jgi:hypothetical protein